MENVELKLSKEFLEEAEKRELPNIPFIAWCMKLLIDHGYWFKEKFDVELKMDLDGDFSTIALDFYFPKGSSLMSVKPSYLWISANSDDEEEFKTTRKGHQFIQWVEGIIGRLIELEKEVYKENILQLFLQDLEKK